MTALAEKPFDRFADKARPALGGGALARAAGRLPRESLARAVSDAVLSPGKRLRPLVALAAGELAGAPAPAAAAVAVAVEYVHAASLVLDDLPSMDNARRRRGRPALHVVHGVAAAELVAVLLVARAFEIVAGAPGVSAATRARMARELARSRRPALLRGSGRRPRGASPSDCASRTSSRSTPERPAPSSSRRCAAARSPAERASRCSSALTRFRPQPGPGLPDHRRPARPRGGRRRSWARIAAATRTAPTSRTCSARTPSRRLVEELLAPRPSKRSRRSGAAAACSPISRASCATVARERLGRGP